MTDWLTESGFEVTLRRSTELYSVSQKTPTPIFVHILVN